MGKSYPGKWENFSTSQILLFCSYGETLSRLPGKVSGCDVALNINWTEKLLTRQKVILLSGKVVFIWEKHPGHRDLACQQGRSRYTGKLFVSYELKLFILFSYQGEISLVNLSKSFLANRNNFFPCI
jgi:hypothetical protein